MILVTTLVILIIIFNLFIYIAVKRSIRVPDSEESLIFISIVIAAKNEGQNIEPLINSLLKQTYPSEFFEIIIVDDNSVDNTLNIAVELTKNIPHFLVVKCADERLYGKRAALSTGIKKAKGKFVMITDADCLPQQNWISVFASKFSEGFDFLFGAAPFLQTGSLVNKISCYENLRASLLTFAAAGLGIPYSAAARSFGFSKESFEKIGGFSNTTDTLSGDDDLLLREAVKHKLKIGVVPVQDSLVYSSTKNNFKEYFRQKARHTQSSFHYLFKHKMLLSFYHIINLMSLLIVPLLIFDQFYLVPLLIKILLDTLMAEEYQKEFGYKFSYAEIVYHQILYEIFLIVHFINAKLGRIAWK